MSVGSRRNYAAPLLSSRSTKVRLLENQEILFLRSQIMERIGKPLVVQPVLMYNLLERKEAVTWREWGGLHTTEDVEEEVTRINMELQKLKSHADFSVDLLPLMEVNSDIKAIEANNIDCDVILLYAAGTAGNTVYDKKWISSLTNSGKDIVMFLRHKSGPVYLWYEIVHPKLLRNHTDEFTHKHLSLSDIVVDDYNKILIRLRALYGLKNVKQSKILAVGGVGSWGGHIEVVRKTNNEVWQLSVFEIDLNELNVLVNEKHNNPIVQKEAEKDTEKLIAHESTISVNTKKEFIKNTFILYYSLRELMD